MRRMKSIRSISAGLAIVLSAWLPSGTAAQAGLHQFDGQFPGSGGIVAPFFDGWFANPDGSITLSFGYMNRNTDEVVEIPLGPNNFIEPAEYDGIQPTSFSPVRYQGYSGRRERGVFSVTIPAAMRNTDVVWTLTHAGETFRIPGRTRSTTYELSLTPMGSGSLPPLVRFSSDGPEGRDRTGVMADRITTSVGTPVTLRLWAEDQGIREERYAVNMTWQKHQGPGSVTFSPASTRIPTDTGEGTTTATFGAPGEYLLRVRVDNFSARDSNFGFQCCWTNGYVPVTVTP